MLHVARTHASRMSKMQLSCIGTEFSFIQLQTAVEE